MKTLLLFLLSATAVLAQIRTDAGLSAYWQTNAQQQAVLYVVGHPTIHVTWEVWGHAFPTTNATGTEIAAAPPPPSDDSCTNDWFGSISLVDSYLSGQFVSTWAGVTATTGGGTACAVSLYLTKTGSPTGGTTVTIRGDAAGLPGTILATSDVVTNSTMSAGWVKFSFPTPLQLSGFRWYIVMESDRTATDYVSWQMSQYTGGSTFYWDGAAWQAYNSALGTYWFYQ